MVVGQQCGGPENKAPVDPGEPVLSRVQGCRGVSAWGPLSPKRLELFGFAVNFWTETATAGQHNVGLVEVDAVRAGAEPCCSKGGTAGEALVRRKIKHLNRSTIPPKAAEALFTA